MFSTFKSLSTFSMLILFLCVSTGCMGRTEIGADGQPVDPTDCPGGSGSSEDPGSPGGSESPQGSGSTAAATGEEAKKGVDMDESSYLGQGQGVSGWSQSGNLITGNPNQIVSMQCELPAGNHTIQIGGSPPSSGAQTEAIITWTVNGNPVIRRVTVGTGVSVTGMGQAVRVQVVDVTSPLFFVGGVQYGVTISCTKGTRATTMSPPTLVPGPVAPLPPGAFNIGPGTYQLNAGISLNIPIPQGLGIVNVWVSGLITGAGAVVVNGSNSQAEFQNGGVTMGLFPPNLGTWTPVPPGATVLTLTNNTAASAIFFYVAFGVDG